MDNRAIGELAGKEDFGCGREAETVSKEKRDRAAIAMLRFGGAISGDKEAMCNFRAMS